VRGPHQHQEEREELPLEQPGLDPFRVLCPDLWLAKMMALCLVQYLVQVKQLVVVTGQALFLPQATVVAKHQQRQAQATVRAWSLLLAR